MQLREIRTTAGVILWLMVVSLVFVTCSDDCPTCPPDSVQWVVYDNFDDDSLDTGLWNYIPDC